MLCMGHLWITVNVKLVILVPVVFKIHVLELAVQLWEVVIRTIRQAFVPDVAELFNLMVADVSIHIQNNGEQRDGHEQESDRSQKPAKPHMGRQMFLGVNQLAEIIIVLQVRLKRRHS